MRYAALEWRRSINPNSLFPNQEEHESKNDSHDGSAVSRGRAVCFASDDAHMGTWKLKRVQMKISAGTPKNTTVVYEVAGDKRESHGGWSRRGW